MLKLKRVEIQGFKSFCDRTEMKFHGEGVAAIVGPNGCGKSNLSDAISWVLGEQSAKTLRGSRMEDVIFSGTRDRKPLSLAAVTITLADPEFHAGHVVVANGNGNGHHEAAHAVPPIIREKEITITRRLFRNGESEYLINGRMARLRDIQDLFMGTGLGPESYAIIEQGRIGQILSTKPADRRGVIEEAAGITRFKTRRRLAEAKLEGAKQNLNRVFDILEEVGRQANSLKRQASKAKRYEELKTELTGQLRMALGGRFQILERDASKTAIELNFGSAEVQALGVEVGAEETKSAALRERCFAVEGQLTDTRRALSELRLEAERTRGRLEYQASQIADIERRLGQGEAETADLDQRLAERLKESEASTAQLVEIQAGVGEGRVRLAARQQERDVLENELRERERSIEASRQQVLRLLGEVSSYRNQLASVEGLVQSIERDSVRIRRDEELSTGDLVRLAELKTTLSDRIASRQMELESTVDQRKRIDGDLVARRGQAQETRAKLDQRRTELSRLKARKDSLEEILSHRAYTTESVKRLFTAIDKGQVSGLKPLGVLADFVEVDPAYEKATEEFLHEELEYVVVENWEAAQRGIELMRSDLDGRATFLVHPEPGSAMNRGAVAEPPIGPETGILARLSDVMHMTNGLTRAPSELLPRLSRCYLVENRDAAQRLALQYPDIYFLLPDGVCYYGYALAGGKKTGSGPLALKRELRELTALERQRDTEMQASALGLERLEAEIAALAEALEKLRTAQQTQEKEALALDHESRKLAEEFQRASQRLSVAKMELERLNRDRARAAEQKATLDRQVAEREEERTAQEHLLASSRESLEELQGKVAAASEAHAALRAEMASLEERLRSIEATQQRLESQTHELARRKQFLGEELSRMGVDKARLMTDNIDLDRKAGEFAAQIASVEAQVLAMSAQEATSRAELASVDERLKALRIASQEAQERRNAIELELVRKQSDLKHLDETCQAQLSIPVAELAAQFEATLDEAALVESEERVREINRRIEALGPVNAQALEEFEEAQHRYDFLNEQRQDLLDSIRDTEKAIREIDVESRKRFNEAFERINANFREMFRTLFNGGLGEMRLTDADNAYDSGIDIVAQPPGKRLQNVLLLSGGERAMTAMALLMAIFKYQPSPFCILDEVDAPLDEPNIERLTRLLKEMSEQTQFIVITHAKRTMEAAQALYGVTMQEPGVSKLVSVRFQAPPPPPPPAIPLETAAMA